MKPKPEYEPVVMTGNVRAVTATEEIDLTYGQVIDEEMAERLGDGKLRSLIATRSAISQPEFENFDKGERNPLIGDRIPDVPADKATLEQLSDPIPGGSRKIDDRPLPSDHPLAGRPFGALTEEQKRREVVPGGVIGQSAPSALSEGAGPAWHSTPVSELDVDEATRHALVAGNLNTVGDVLAHGRDNDGLGSIEGIGETREQHIQKAIEKVARKHK